VLRIDADGLVQVLAGLGREFVLFAPFRQFEDRIGAGHVGAGDLDLEVGRGGGDRGHGGQDQEEDEEKAHAGLHAD